MIDPIFWLGLSILLVAVSITAVLIAAVPAFRELSRAARSAEKLFDTLNRELPPTLEAIRLTGLEITDLTDDVTQGVQSAGQVVKQVDQSLSGVKQQVQKVQTTTRSVVAGAKAAWQTLTQTTLPRNRRSGTANRSLNHSEQRRLNADRASEVAQRNYFSYPELDDWEDEAYEPENSHAAEAGDRSEVDQEVKRQEDWQPNPTEVKDL